jgi:ornithine racemase
VTTPSTDHPADHPTDHAPEPRPAPWAVGHQVGAPRLEIDLAKIGHNARALVERLGARGIGVTAVTKAALGSADIAATMLSAGVRRLGDSRIDNLEVLRAAAAPAKLTLIRTPMLSQVARVVAHADVSLNSEPAVLEGLSRAAQERGVSHGVALMVEMGDLREGILAGDLADAVRATLRLPNIELVGIGTNLACRSGAVPDAAKMDELSALVEMVELAFGLRLDLVSGGNSANLTWALGTDDVGRINDLRLGEAILLGREPLHRRPVEGLHLDALTIVAEVIESKVKPSLPWGHLAQAAFGATADAVDHGPIPQAILAIGEQDIDPRGIEVAGTQSAGVEAAGITIVGASSDHLVVTSEELLPVGSEVRFRPNYSALLRAMTSPFVRRTLLRPAEVRPNDGAELPAA